VGAARQPGDHAGPSDPAYQSAVAPDNEASEYKTAFTTEWNSLADRYGLNTYQQGRL